MSSERQLERRLEDALRRIEALERQVASLPIRIGQNVDAAVWAEFSEVSP